MSGNPLIRTRSLPTWPSGTDDRFLDLPPQKGKVDVVFREKKKGGADRFIQVPIPPRARQLNPLVRQGGESEYNDQLQNVMMSLSSSCNRNAQMAREEEEGRKRGT